MRRFFQKVLWCVPFYGGYGITLFVLGGLVCHSSWNPRICGRYSPVLFACIVATFLLCVLWKPLVLAITKPGPARRRRVTGTLILAMVVLGVSEIYARRLAARFHEARAREEAEYDPFLQNRLQPDEALHVNAAGFRGDPIPSVKSTNTFRIFMLGGSTVLSGRTPYAQCHSRLLQRRLAAQYPLLRIEVQNAGNDWHTSQHSLMKYCFQIRNYEPDLVIVWHAINDLCRTCAPPAFSRPGSTFAGDYSHFYGPVAGIVRKYFDPDQQVAPVLNFICIATLGDALYSSFRRGSTGTEQPVDIWTFSGLPLFRRNLESLILETRHDGVPIVLATQPSLYREDLTLEEQKVLWMNRQFCTDGKGYPSAKAMRRGMDLYNQVTRDVATAWNVPLVDLATTIPSTSAFFRDDCHYTVEGDRRVAAAIFRRLVDDSLVSLPPVQAASQPRQAQE